MLRRQFGQGAVVAATLALIPGWAQASQAEGCAVFNIGEERGSKRALLTPHVIWTMFAQAGFRVEHIYLNAYDYADIRKFGRDVIDIQCHAELLRIGIQACMWEDEDRTVKGAEFRTRADVAKGVVIMASAEVAEKIPQLTWPGHVNKHFPWFQQSLQQTPIWTMDSKEPSGRPLLV